MDDASDQRLKLIYIAGLGHGALIAIRDLLMAPSADRSYAALRRADEAIEVIESLLFDRPRKGS